MQGGEKIRLYMSFVCFRNMGPEDQLFNMRGRSGEFGAYTLCCAFADSSATYRSIVENLADSMRTGIVEMRELAEGTPAILDSLKHLHGVYTDGNLFFFEKPDEEKPYRKPGAPPPWRVAHVRFQDGTARYYYALAGSDDFYRKLLHLFAARYGLQIAETGPVQEVQAPSLFKRIMMRLRGTPPGVEITHSQFAQLQNAHQDMGLYRF